MVYGEYIVSIQYIKITTDTEGNVLSQVLVSVPVGLEPMDSFCKGVQVIWQRVPPGTSVLN